MPKGKIRLADAPVESGAGHSFGQAVSRGKLPPATDADGRFSLSALDIRRSSEQLDRLTKRKYRNGGIET